MIELKKESERVLLVGVGLPGQDDVEDSLKELSEKKIKLMCRILSRYFFIWQCRIRSDC